jgi:hypothetical protein
MALKVGTEDKKKVYIASALGVVVLGLAIYVFHDSFSSGTPAPPPPTPVVAAPPVRATTPSTTTGHEATKLPGNAADLDPTLHPELMAQAESLEYTGKGRNIFSLTSMPVEIPQPVKTARNTTPLPVPTGPPPPAPPPAIELTFFGYSSRQSGIRRAFLLKGDDVFIASEGDVVDHRYKVVKIAPSSVQVEDIPYANTQSLPLVAN